jgi:hypothetical protein
MMLIWVVVVIFAGDTYGILPNPDLTYPSLEECQKVAQMIPSVGVERQQSARAICVGIDKKAVS